MELIKYLNSYAVIINKKGKVLDISDLAKSHLQIELESNFFELCVDPAFFAESSHRLLSKKVGAKQQQNFKFNFGDKEELAIVTLLNDSPVKLLIEIDANKERKIDSPSKDLINNSNNLLSLVDRNYQYLSVNDRYSEVWGLPNEQIIEQHVSNILGEEMFKSVVKKELDTCFKGKSVKYTDWFYSEHKKQMLFLRVVYNPVFDSKSGEVKSVAVTITDITDIQLKNESLQDKAYFDSLTYLHNRHAMNDYFTKITSPLTARENYCLVMIDLDNFKQINDIYGHSAGDQTLRAFALKLKAKLRRNDFCCRWGGDEFLLIFEENENEEAWLNRKYIGERLQSIQQNKLTFDNISISLSFSFGLSHFSDASLKLEELIAVADKDMYQAKLMSS